MDDGSVADDICRALDILIALVVISNTDTAGADRGLAHIVGFNGFLPLFRESSPDCAGYRFDQTHRNFLRFNVVFSLRNIG
jgi:hypothetical protein